MGYGGHGISEVTAAALGGPCGGRQSLWEGPSASTEREWQGVSVADAHSELDWSLPPARRHFIGLQQFFRLWRVNTIDMRTMWVQKRVNLEALDENSLTRSIGTFEEALRVRSGAILQLERERSSSSRPMARILYELPIEQN